MKQKIQPGELLELVPGTANIVQPMIRKDMSKKAVFVRFCGCIFGHSAWKKYGVHIFYEPVVGIALEDSYLDENGEHFVKVLLGGSCTSP